MQRSSSSKRAKLAVIRGELDSIKQVNKMVAMFNNIPFIDTSYSDEFMTRADVVVKSLLPRWKEYLSYEPPSDEQDPMYIIRYSDGFRNVSKSELDKMYARCHPLDEKRISEILTRLFQKVVIYTNKDLDIQLQKACTWLNKFVGDRRIEIAILEYSPKAASAKFKSKDWMLHQALRYLRTPPQCIGYYESVAARVQSCLIIDDGIYSGTQIVFEMNKIFKSSPSASIYLVTAFMAQAGLDYIEKFFKFDYTRKYTEYNVYKRGENSLYLWTGYVLIPSVQDDLVNICMNYPEISVLDDIHSAILDKCGSLAVFEHKIPDYKSLPWIVSNVFSISMAGHYVHTPPYAPKDGKFIKNTSNDFTFDCVQKQLVFRQL